VFKAAAGSLYSIFIYIYEEQKAAHTVRQNARPLKIVSCRCGTLLDADQFSIKPVWSASSHLDSGYWYVLLSEHLSWVSKLT
jgi:hypothetical protein